MKASSFISQVRPGWFWVTVHAKPGARHSSLAARPSSQDEALEIRVGAPPVEGKANTELIDFMQTLLEQHLAQFRANTLLEACQTGNGAKHKRGKRSATNAVTEMGESDMPEKVRVALVRGGTSRNKVLEVAFPGTEDELLRVLQMVET